MNYWIVKKVVQLLPPKLQVKYHHKKKGSFDQVLSINTQTQPSRKEPNKRSFSIFSKNKTLNQQVIISGEFTNEEFIIPLQVVEGLRMLGEIGTDPKLIEMFQDCDIQNPVKLLNDVGVYEGQWSHGIRNGYGKLLYKNNSYYEGYWINNVRHFQGRFVDQNGEAYTGQWFSDQMFGDGKFYFNDGAFVQKNTGSQLKSRSLLCKQAKKPTISYPDGRLYYGDFASGERNGFGVSIQKDLTEYYGFYKNDEPEGYGFLAYADKRTYQGQWANGSKSGIGEFTWPDGRFFVGNYDFTIQGNFEDDLRQGYGMFIYANGQKYRGQYLAGEMTGQGRMVDLLGNCIEGQWENGKRTKQSKTISDPFEFDQANICIENQIDGRQDYIKPLDENVAIEGSEYSEIPPTPINYPKVEPVEEKEKKKGKKCCHCL